MASAYYRFFLALQHKTVQHQNKATDAWAAPRGSAARPDQTRFEGLIAHLTHGTVVALYNAQETNGR
jgi:hypothetical protein